MRQPCLTVDNASRVSRIANCAYSGLYDYNARGYDPTMGRFISEDPSGFDGGDANLFCYVGNDPINSTDPTGLFQAGNRPMAYLSQHA